LKSNKAGKRAISKINLMNNGIKTASLKKMIKNKADRLREYSSRFLRQGLHFRGFLNVSSLHLT